MNKIPKIKEIETIEEEVLDNFLDKNEKE